MPCSVALPQRGILSLVPFWRPPVLARPFWNRISGDGSEFGILKTWFSILASALGVASSVCLYRGSEETPVSTQWYKRTTPEEDKFRRKRRRWAVAGFVLLGAAFAMQAAAALLS